MTNPNAAAFMGIDLGTTFSCVGLWKPGDDEPQIVPDGDARIVPSVVSFDQNGQVTVGREAVENGIKGKTVVYDGKRLIGRRMNDPQLEKMKPNWPFALSDDS